MPKLILHAGLHKTGTSAIQRFCARNRDRLLAAKILYPSTHTFEAHHLLAEQLKNSSTSDAKLILSDYFSRWVIPFAECEVVILSSEIFSEGIDPGFIEFLYDHVDSIDLVFYVRRQDELLESAYAQQVRQNKETRYINEFMPYMVDLVSHINWFSNYIRPGSDVKVRVFDRQLLHEGDIVKDFVYHVLLIPSISEYDNTSALVNQSLSVPSCLLMRYINSLELCEETRQSIMLALAATWEPDNIVKMKLLSDEYEAHLFDQVASSNIVLDEKYLGYPYFAAIKPRNLMECSYECAVRLVYMSGMIEKIQDLLPSKTIRW